jgi:hypothetical protein
MRISKQIIALVVAVAFATTIGSIFTYRTAKWVSGRMHPAAAIGIPSPPPELASTRNASSGSTTLHPVQVAAPMSDAFDNGVLPAPLGSSADPDSAVVTLAKQIAARGENSTPALMTALRMAGFTIRGKDGSLLLKPGDAGQGMALDAWQVAAMAKLYDEHWQLSLADLSEILTKCLPELRKADLNNSLLHGINSSAQGNQPLRFWSRLIIELGRNATQPSDLSSANSNPGAVQLDAIQTALILQRLAGDLTVAGGSNSPSSPTIKASAYRESVPSAPRLQFAVYEPEHSPHLVPADEASSGPCTLTENGATSGDIGAILNTTEWKNIVDIEKQGEPATPQQRVNVVLTLLRFYLIYAGLHTEITIDKTPLVRTKDRDPGERAQLTARVFYQLDNWGLNCFVAFLRPLLNRAGMDMGNLPNNGGVDGAGVAWYLTEGGPDTSIEAVDQQTADAQNATWIVDFVPPYTSTGAEGLHNLVKQVTTDGGMAKMPIQGHAQAKDLTRSKLVALDKTAAVAVEVKFKGADADPRKFLDEMIDVFGPALGVASGDLLGGFVAGLTEMLYRMNWRVGNDFTFTVRDWQECEGGWIGMWHTTITRHTIRTTPLDRNNGTRTFADDLTERGDWSFVGVSKDDPSKVQATWSADFKQNMRRADEFGNGGHDIDETKTEGSGKGNCIMPWNDVNDSLVLYGANGSCGGYPVTTRGSSDYSGQSGHIHQDMPAAIGGRGPLMGNCGKNCAADPKNLDHFQGSLTTVRPDGSTEANSWEIYKCSDSPR